MATKTQLPSIDSIESLGNGTVLIVANDERTAKQLLKRNPYASVQRSSADDRIALVYAAEQCNLLNSIKRA
jgi:hypothetical protein